MTAPAPIRVAIVDDSFLIREGLATLLALSPRVVLTAKHADPAALLAAVEADPPDVVITDIRMPPTHTDEGMQLAETLRRSHPAIGVIVLSQHGSAQYAVQLLARGAAGRGYLLKDRLHDLEQLVSTVEAVARGECRIDPQLVQSLVVRGRERSLLDELTPRQREILADIAEGHSNLGIARLRGLTQRAVEKHISEIFGRLGLSNDETISRRVHAAMLFLSSRTAA